MLYAIYVWDSRISNLTLYDFYASNRILGQYMIFLHLIRPLGNVRFPCIYMLLYCPRKVQQIWFSRNLHTRAVQCMGRCKNFDNCIPRWHLLFWSRRSWLPMLCKNQHLLFDKNRFSLNCKLFQKYNTEEEIDKKYSKLIFARSLSQRVSPPQIEPLRVRMNKRWISSKENIFFVNIWKRPE